MINIDKQRVAAVRKLEALGYSYRGDEWVPASPSAVAGPRSLMTAECDAMHGVLVQRADALEGCLEGSEEERERAAITDVIEAYESVRWPNGKIDGGKG
jgi:hypothetical protein